MNKTLFVYIQQHLRYTIFYNFFFVLLKAFLYTIKYISKTTTTRKSTWTINKCLIFVFTNKKYTIFLTFAWHTNLLFVPKLNIYYTQTHTQTRLKLHKELFAFINSKTNNNIISKYQFFPFNSAFWSNFLEPHFPQKKKPKRTKPKGCAIDIKTVQ